MTTETVEVTRKVTFHLTDSGRASVRSLSERLDMLVDMYKQTNAPEIAKSLADTRELLGLLTDGKMADYLLDVAEGLHGYVEPSGDES